MQLVRRGDARAFEVDLRTPLGGRVLARLSDDGHALGRRGRHAGRVPVHLALRRPLRPRARLGPHLGARHRPPPRDRRAAAGHRARPPPRRRRGHRGALRGDASAPTSRPPAARRPATVRGALESLPADQCQVIELAYFGGFTHTEIAEMLDAPVGTIKGRMRLGLKKMRAQLGEGPGGGMSADHDRWVDAAGAYVLGAMPARRARRRSRSTSRPARPAAPRSTSCCRPPRRCRWRRRRCSPPTALKDRIMAEVEREAALLAQAGPGGRPARARNAAACRFVAGRLAARAGRGGAVRRRPCSAVSSLTGSAQHVHGIRSNASGATAHVKVDDDQATLVRREPAGAARAARLRGLAEPKGSDVPEPTSALFKPRGDGSAEAKLPGSHVERRAGPGDATSPPSGPAKPTGDVLIASDAVLRAPHKMGC